MSNVIRFKRNDESEIKSEQIHFPSPTHPEPKNNKKAYLISLVGIAVALVLGGRWYWISISEVSTDNAYVETELFPVNSRMMGFVKAVYVEENQPVKKGMKLLELDHSDVNIELEYKEARLKKATKDFERAERLFKSQAISKSDYEMIETNFIAMQADRDGSRLKLSFTEVIAQTYGIIAKKSVHVGQFIQPGQNLFMIVGSYENNWVRANFKETQIQKIKPGQKVHLKFDAYSDGEWEGEVVEIYPSSGSILSLLPPENATGNFTKIVQRIPVKIAIKNGPPLVLRAGTSAHATVHLR